MYKIKDVDVSRIVYSEIHDKKDSRAIYIMYNDVLVGKKKPLVVILPEMSLVNNIIKVEDNKCCTHEFFLKIDQINQAVSKFFNDVDDKIIKDCIANKAEWFGSGESEYKKIIREYDDTDMMKFKIVRTSNFKTVVFDSNKNIVNSDLESHFESNCRIKCLVEISSILIKDGVCCLHVRLLQIMCGESGNLPTYTSKSKSCASDPTSSCEESKDTIIEVSESSSE